MLSEICGFKIIKNFVNTQIGLLHDVPRHMLIELQQNYGELKSEFKIVY